MLPPFFSLFETKRREGGAFFFFLFVAAETQQRGAKQGATLADYTKPHGRTAPQVAQSDLSSDAYLSSYLSIPFRP
jgi:hypothetical protein